MQETDTLQLDTSSEDRNAFISVDEMAKQLSIARGTAYQLTKTDGFPCFFIGRRIMIPIQSFHKWVEEQASQRAALIAR